MVLLGSEHIKLSSEPLRRRKVEKPKRSNLEKKSKQKKARMRLAQAVNTQRSGKGAFTRTKRSKAYRKMRRQLRKAGRSTARGKMKS